MFSKQEPSDMDDFERKQFGSKGKILFNVLRKYCVKNVSF